MKENDEIKLPTNTTFYFLSWLLSFGSRKLIKEWLLSLTTLIEEYWKKENTMKEKNIFKPAASVCSLDTLFLKET